jgi:hypothetical protein
MLAGVVCTVELCFSAVTTTSDTEEPPSPAGAVSARAWRAMETAVLQSKADRAQLAILVTTIPGLMKLL